MGDTTSKPAEGLESSQHDYYNQARNSILEVLSRLHITIADDATENDALAVIDRQSSEVGSGLRDFIVKTRALASQKESERDPRAVFEQRLARERLLNAVRAWETANSAA